MAGTAFIRLAGGYAAFSVSESSRTAVIRYIRDQETHHRRISFQDEFLALLRRHGVEFDDRYVWTQVLRPLKRADARECPRVPRLSPGATIYRLLRRLAIAHLQFVQAFDSGYPNCES